VIEAVFPHKLPESTTREHPARGRLRRGRVLVCEVQQHLGDDRIRAVALDTTDGIARGTEVIDTGAPIRVPVGRETLGRIFNLLGETLDEGKPISDDVERWPIHRDAPTIEAVMPTTEMFETGIKVIDCWRPTPRAASWTVRRCRCRQDVIIQELINNLASSTVVCPPSAAWGSVPVRATTLVGDEGIRRYRQDHAGLRSDERAARRPYARRADRF